MGFFDRFRRSSKPESEEPSARREDPIRSAQGANKTKAGSDAGGSQPDQELLDAIAAILDGKEPNVSSSTESSISPDASSEREADLAKTLSILMGEKPEPEEESESESSYEEDVNDAIDTVVGMMREMPGAAELQERIRRYAESTQGQDDEPEPVSEPEAREEPSDEPAEDLLASIAALMGQDAPMPEPEPAAQSSQEPEPEEQSTGESTEDLLAGIGALIGQEPLEPEPEPVEQPSSEPEPAPDENPFSAIAELMGQSSTDPKPQDEPEPSGNDGDGEDLLASIAALMGGSMYASDQHEAETPTKPEIDPDLVEMFASLCAESERFQDEGALESALAKYLQASVSCEKSAALKGMALHLAAAFMMHQVGDGFSASTFARESLECGDEFQAYAQEHQIEGQPNAYMESLQIAALTATSYDEALEYADQGVKLYGDDFGPMADELRQYRAEHPRFADYQRSESLKHYSRVSAEEDKGDYAPAMALMDIILRNAKEAAYCLSYEEQAQIIDDYGTLTIMHMLGKARSLGLSQDDFSNELSFIADGALFRLEDFMPVCKPTEQQNIERIIQGMKMLPGVSGRRAFEPFK